MINDVDLCTRETRTNIRPPVVVYYWVRKSRITTHIKVKVYVAWLYPIYHRQT